MTKALLDRPDADSWVWAGETDIKGEHVAAEKVRGNYYVHFYDAGEHVEETPPLDEPGWLQLVASRFCGGRIP